MSANPVTGQTRLSLAFGGHSAAGAKSGNQDAFALARPGARETEHHGWAAALADGVSNASHGGPAAVLSVTNFVQDFYATPASWSTHRRASKLLAALNHWLCHCGLGQQQWLTTFSALVLKGNQGYLYQVGDSQVALIRDGQWQVLTASHNNGRVLTRALGADPHLRVDTHELRLQAGDRFVLSSDGFHDHLRPKQIKAELSRQEDLETSAQRLVRLAQQQGSRDNISCLIIEVQQCPGDQPQQLLQQWQHLAIPPVLAAGQSLDHYQVVRCLHASPRSHLYLVRDRQQGGLWVLKAPSPNLEDHHSQLAALAREAWVGQCLSHPNLMTTRLNHNSRFLYLICEYIDGQTLSQWHQDHPTPEIQQLRPVVDGIVAGLRALQRQQMVHRDLKPDNIMIDADGHIKLIDFGSVGAGSLQELPGWQQLSQAVGTVDYSAPETQLEQPADNRSDLFSLGIILYELLCGQRPYANKRPGQRKRFSDWRYRSLRQWQPNQPLWLDQLLQQATAADPKRRLSSLSELQQRLRHPRSDANEPSLPLAKRHPVRFWQGISAVLMAALIAQWLLG
ncbi:bifunctional protein-serine/threonine kinase/phosphatase [Ferrimonas kyonanensis]|uniref:bifunctional protein-serine/threonine kinase/phosphatase n=1 Tax=Ferrimonas kyonanensis TaxID=364763 RepID=UPI0003F85546|nr:bifunctional protein-serine/threonine kinase/phosphatase [Ferrimonas kyonanensis]